MKREVPFNVNISELTEEYLKLKNKINRTEAEDDRYEYLEETLDKYIPDPPY